MKIYETEFTLINPVNDLKAAQKYLVEDDMTEFLVADAEYNEQEKNLKQGRQTRLSETIRDVQWNLEDENSGRITLITDRELTEKELEYVSEWVSGQCSDGLGEGFEQQEFAEVESEEDHDWDDEDYYDDDLYCEMASFDWETNKYHFSDVTDMRQEYAEKRLAEKEANAEKIQDMIDSFADAVDKIQSENGQFL